VKFCRCREPRREVDGDGIAYCGQCEELLPTALEEAVPQLLRTVAALKRQIDDLTGRHAGPDDPPPDSTRMLDVRQTAAMLGVSTDYVYRHQEQLGVKRLGAVGPDKKPPLRFDPDLIARAMTAKGPEPEPEPRRRPAPRNAGTGSVELLPIRKTATQETT
jgi:hypothetical protein